MGLYQIFTLVCAAFVLPEIQVLKDVKAPIINLKLLAWFCCENYECQFQLCNFNAKP